MTRITPEHLARGAFVYVRQSTSDQVLTITKAGAGSTGLSIAPAPWAGPPSR